MLNWFRMQAEGGNKNPVPKPEAPQVLEVLSVEQGKGDDQIVTVGNKDGGVFHQYVRRGFGHWYLLPTLEEIDWYRNKFEDKLKRYFVKKDYLDFSTETRVSLVMKSKTKQIVKCLFCHSEMSDKAQVCLSCGGMLCLSCSPTVEKCPTLGCK